jgi:Fic family protein
MTWNWQKADWPHFKYDKTALSGVESRYLQSSGILLGALKHIGRHDKDQLTVDLISIEALKTSEIEGEMLNRDSLQSSIRRNFGLDTDKRKVPPAEQGIAEMMVDLYRTFDEPLSHDMMFRWHKMLTKGRKDLKDIGQYRSHKEPMQVVSGALHDPAIHFEAPPSKDMKRQMSAFIDWFNTTAPTGKTPLPALTRSGLAHLYFECIHPFEDGNGRIGRALAEKVLSQAVGAPTLIALSLTIQNAKKEYYRQLELNNKDLSVTSWLEYFASTILQAQDYSQRFIDFLIDKTKLYDRLRGHLNDRQEKVLSRMFREGLEGFKGGLSAENYIKISGASRATATRDLSDLVAKGALVSEGALKHTRYYLNILPHNKA